ncbi:MAG: hypothetical protein ACO1SV_04405 [Fimbriimonas sp.]
MSTSNAETSGRLIVDRTADDDIKIRDLYVLVDEEEERTVLYGKSLEYVLAPGEHRIKITNRLFSKVENFQVGAGQTIRFAVANVPAGGGLFAPLMMVSGTGAYKVRIRPA